MYIEIEIKTETDVSRVCSTIHPLELVSEHTLKIGSLITSRLKYSFYTVPCKLLHVLHWNDDC